MLRGIIEKIFSWFLGSVVPVGLKGDPFTIFMFSWVKSQICMLLLVNIPENELVEEIEIEIKKVSTG